MPNPYVAVNLGLPFLLIVFLIRCVLPTLPDTYFSKKQGCLHSLDLLLGNKGVFTKLTTTTPGFSYFPANLSQYFLINTCFLNFLHRCAVLLLPVREVCLRRFFSENYRSLPLRSTCIPSDTSAAGAPRRGYRLRGRCVCYCWCRATEAAYPVMIMAAVTCVALPERTLASPS